MHGVLGAALLRDNGFPEEIARVAERHTGAGISRDDIEEQGLPMPPGDYMPETLLERLICYADKFYSKSGRMEEKPLEKVEASMARLSALPPSPRGVRLTSDIPVLSRGVETGTRFCCKLTVAVDGSRGITAAEGANDFYE